MLRLRVLALFLSLLTNPTSHCPFLYAPENVIMLLMHAVRVHRHHWIHFTQLNVIGCVSAFPVELQFACHIWVT